MYKKFTANTISLIMSNSLGILTDNKVNKSNVLSPTRY